MVGECRKAKREDYEACIMIARYADLRLHEVMRIDTTIARAALKTGFITIKGGNNVSYKAQSLGNTWFPKP